MAKNKRLALTSSNEVAIFLAQADLLGEILQALALEREGV